jgi:CheY-like chemotaxis protein
MHFAASGEEALNRLTEEIQPALIAVLSDINMPGMDGLELLGEIKQLRPDLPVMMVTAYGDDETDPQRSALQRAWWRGARSPNIGDSPEDVSTRPRWKRKGMS